YGHVGAPRLRAQPPACLVPVHPRHPEIEQHDIGNELAGHVQRFHAVVGRAHFMAQHVDEHAQAGRRVVVVVHHQHFHSLLPACARERGCSCACSAAIGSLTMNSLPLPSPALRACTRPPCRSTIVRTSDRPMPRPPSRRVKGWPTCTNRPKMLSRSSGRMPRPLSLTDTWTSGPAGCTLR